MRVDFRTEYETISVISFTLTFLFFQSINNFLVNIPGLPIFLQGFLLSLGFYSILFRLILFVYNRWFWKVLGHQDINIDGYWEYTIQRETNWQRKGYAVIKQDMYNISIYGFNVGSGSTQSGVAIWRSSNSYISHKTFTYDYELIGERPGRGSRLARGHAIVELIGPPRTWWQKWISPPPVQMAGNWYDMPISGDVVSGLGSILFEKVEDPAKLPKVVKSQFVFTGEGDIEPNADILQGAHLPGFDPSEI